jgi:hypothetical protein
MYRLRYSHLKWMARSALHCRWATRDEQDETLSMKMGSGFHARLAGKPVVVATMPRSEKLTKVDGSPTAYGEWLAKQPEGALVLTQKEYDVSARMADAVLSDKDAAPLIARATTLEKTIEWTMLGVQCSGIPDAFGGGTLLEFKSDRDGTPHKFRRTAKWRGYPGQVCWYEEGLRRSGLQQTTDRYVICVENWGPCCVVVHEMQPSIREYGNALWSGWFESYRVAAENDVWNGYAQGVVPWEDEDQDGEELDMAS